jgi:hypothetical protein
MHKYLEIHVCDLLQKDTKKFDKLKRQTKSESKPLSLKLIDDNRLE